MKRKPNMQKWLPAVMTGLALAASTSLGLAADISYSFDSGLEGWTAADAHGSVVWDNNIGRGSNGCLKCTIVAGTDTEIDPRVDVAFDTVGYFSVEFDMMVDAASGVDSLGNYGNLQVVARDAAWSWDAMWYGSMGGPTGKFTNWVHVTRVFASAYGPKAHLQFQIQSGDTATPYTTNVIVYIDNVVIRDGTPPTKAMLYSFTWPEECVPGNSWGGGGSGAPSFSQDFTKSTNGCLKYVVPYATNSAWQDAPSELQGPAFDPGKFTFIDFDLYLEAPTGLSTYGGFELHYWWSWTSLGSAGLSAANIGKWTHYSFPLKPPGSGVNGIVLHPGVWNLGDAQTFTYYLDNVTLWRPAEPPTIKRLVKGSGAGGVQITMDNDSSQWQRDGIATPSGGGPYLWASQGAYPVSYSFTITNFPDAATRSGFEAHMFLINADTDSGTGNQTSGAADWNAADLVQFRVQNRDAAAGGVVASIDWKTNRPNDNPPGDPVYHPVVVNGPTAIGTWTLTFSDPTNGVVTGPGITATNFTLPPEVVTDRFSPSADYIQFGVFKADGANDGHNNQASGTYSRVQMVVNGTPTFDDNFPGPDLTTNYDWRKTSATAVQWVPPDIAWWLTWTMPDDGFEAYVSRTVNGTYTDAGVGAATGISYTQGATRVGAVPAASVPPPANATNNAVFFQLRK
jgi:hypothetical protein